MIEVFGLCSVLNKFWGGQCFIRLINIGSEEAVGFVFLGSQLLRRYPGKIPDLELMFDCEDWPVVLVFMVL